MTTKPEPNADWFRQMDEALGDAPGALVVPGGGTYTYAVPPGMSVDALVAHAELLLVELSCRAPDCRSETQRELDVVLAALPSEYRGVLDLLAHDLKMLEGSNEPDGTAVPDDLREQIARSWQKGDFGAVLRLVRAAPTQLEEPERAHALGRGWSAKFPRAAALFFEHAAEVGGAPHRAAVFEALQRAGRTVDAGERAREAINDPEVVVQVAAIRALYLSIQFMPPHQRVSARRDLIDTADRVLGGLTGNAFGTRSLAAAVHVLRGFTHDHLGDPAAALVDFEAAVAASPNNVAARAARGVHLASTAPDQAIEDLSIAFAAQLQHVDVAVALARLLLAKGAYHDSRQICERALSWPNLDRFAEAELREQLALCLHEEGAPERLHQMQLAARLAPDHVRIRHNLAEIVRSLAGEPANLQQPPLPDPPAVGDRTVAAEVPQNFELAA
jgi:tetratricopeptide (TPR) repeat protein